MSQRKSGYDRQERDLYETPEWVTESLLPHVPSSVRRIWEPACGSGKIATVLKRSYLVTATDIHETGVDFLSVPIFFGTTCDAIITNPPYKQTSEFAKHSLAFMRPVRGFVAMLLRTDWDHAKTRLSLTALHPAFSAKIVLTRRIRWFENSKGAPSFNHAWFLWDWNHSGPPIIIYEPKEQSFPWIANAAAS